MIKKLRTVFYELLDRKAINSAIFEKCLVDIGEFPMLPISYEYFSWLSLYHIFVFTTAYHLRFGINAHYFPKGKCLIVLHVYF